MGGAACKVIIDHGHGVTQALACMETSIVLNYEQKTPTFEQQEKFLKAAEALAQIAAEIEKYVSS